VHDVGCSGKDGDHDGTGVIGQEFAAREEGVVKMG